ncbi:MAG: hypothetical protein ACE5KH_00355 [Candidatus Geothermarchaeales archaeon]
MRVHTIAFLLLLAGISFFVIASAIFVRDLAFGSSVASQGLLRERSLSTVKPSFEETFRNYFYANRHELVIEMKDSEYPFRLSIEGVYNDWTMERDLEGSGYLEFRPPLTGLYTIRIIGLEEREMGFSVRLVTSGFLQTGEVEASMLEPLLLASAALAPLGALLYGVGYVRNGRHVG